jgi:2-phospho-L-lactate/phosphoenolpyruvate guanylyltransferase
MARDVETAAAVAARPAAADPADRLDWSVVIPVKLLARAKSRLTGLGDEYRSALVLAMAADTVAAAVRAERVCAVLVVTDDPAVGAVAASLGAQVLPDEPAAGLNDALSYGAAHAHAAWPERGRAALAADVPAVQPEELTAALSAAARYGTAFVPDADGTGTVLYAAAPGSEFRPRFGPRSRDRHLAGGAAELGPGVLGSDLRAVTGLRSDVDTVEDLRRAVALGVGPRTRALLSASDLAGLVASG